jgi:hypothetical protein
MWSSNPAWSESIPRGWVLRSAEQEIVGFIANTPFPYMFDGSPFVYCAIGTLALHAGLRGKGLSQLLGQAALRQMCDVVVGTQSVPAAWRMWMSLGARNLAAKWTKKPRVLVANGTAFAMKALSALGIHSRLLATVLGGGAHLVSRALALFHQPMRARVQVDRIDRFRDEWSEELSALASSHRLQPVRDPRTLNWLYFGANHIRQTRIVLLARSEQVIVGYIAMKKLRSGAAFLLEMRVRKDDPGVAAAILLSAREHLQKVGISHLLLYEYAPYVKSALSASLNFPASAESEFTFFFVPNADDIAVEDWDVGPWDGDSLLA